MQNNDNVVDTADELDAARMKKIAAMARLQRARGRIDNTTRTADDLNAVRMEDSMSISRSQPTMGVINHVTGSVNAIR